MAPSLANGHGGDPRPALLATQLKKVRYRPDALIDVLHAVQDIYGSLSRETLATVADALDLPPSRVMGVATFYHLFTFEPRGEHTCTVCTGTACFVKGADDIVAALEAAHGVPAGETAEDRSFTFTTARCLGSCGMAPVIVVDGVISGHGTVDSALEAVDAALSGAVTV
jgi:bidirectional [NiFe] hydrogenase diaphorase subunit